LLAPLGIERVEWPVTPLGNTSTAGGLLLRARDLLRLGVNYLRGGEGVVPSEWVNSSITPHVRIDDEAEYGYLWWLRSFAGRHSYFMTGTGGNRMHVFPELEAVAVITTTNYGRRDAHKLSDRLLVGHILPLLER
jgi:CubicO group peptidase (beta-lactamase class C family)